jgi:hypothetical protein
MIAYDNPKLCVARIDRSSPVNDCSTTLPSGYRRGLALTAASKAANKSLRVNDFMPVA